MHAIIIQIERHYLVGFSVIKKAETGECITCSFVQAPAMEILMICFDFDSIISAQIHLCFIIVHIQLYVGLHAAGRSLTLDLDFDLLLPCNKVDTLVRLNSTSLHDGVTTDTIYASKQPTGGAM